MAEKVLWRDHAGNLWEASPETSTDVLVKAVDPKNPPTVPVPVSAPAPFPVDLDLTLPDDIGVKMMMSPKTNTPAFKSAHVYWRDADQNLWFSETYTDSAGNSWNRDSLIHAARPGMPPDAPVAQRQF